MVEVIEPFYPHNGRRLYPLETMLRTCMQHWYNLSDGATEDALYEIAHAPVLPGYPRIAPC
jgi:IS5 family transposase